MKISASIIVKNEAAVLKRCLDGVALCADEIVVVDTGSTDVTKAIAAAHPKVRLFDSEFFNKDTHYSDFRFGVAKNEAIRRCIGDWICWFDADDVLDDVNASKILAMLKSSEACVYSLSVVYAGLVFGQDRILPGKRGVLFDETHGCHEFLLTNGLPQRQMRDIVVRHEPVGKSIPSSKRNLGILEKDHFQRGMNDQRTLFYLANSYREACEWGKADEFYGKYLAVSQWREERFFARYYKALCLAKLERRVEAEEECHRAVAEDRRFAEPYCVLGDLAAESGDVVRAELWYKMAAATPLPSDAMLFVNTVFYGEYPLRQIAALRGKQEKKEEVKKDDRRRVVFQLPSEWNLAVMALAALELCAVENRDVRFEVVAVDDKQKQATILFDNLHIGEGDAVILALPDNRRGKSEVEWYTRSAGFVLNKADFDSAAAKARRIVDAKTNSGV